MAAIPENSSMMPALTPSDQRRFNRVIRQVRPCSECASGRELFKQYNIEFGKGSPIHYLLRLERESSLD
jgi:hypothetical protein